MKRPKFIKFIVTKLPPKRESPFRGPYLSKSTTLFQLASSRVLLTIQLREGICQEGRRWPRPRAQMSRQRIAAIVPLLGIEALPRKWCERRPASSAALCVSRRDSLRAQTSNAPSLSRRKISSGAAPCTGMGPTQVQAFWDWPQMQPSLHDGLQPGYPCPRAQSLSFLDVAFWAPC